MARAVAALTVSLAMQIAWTMGFAGMIGGGGWGDQSLVFQLRNGVQPAPAVPPSLDLPSRNGSTKTAGDRCQPLQSIAAGQEVRVRPLPQGAPLVSLAKIHTKDRRGAPRRPRPPPSDPRHLEPRQTRLMSKFNNNECVVLGLFL